MVVLLHHLMRLLRQSRRVAAWATSLRPGPIPRSSSIGLYPLFFAGRSRRLASAPSSPSSRYAQRPTSSPSSNARTHCPSSNTSMATHSEQWTGLKVPCHHSGLDPILRPLTLRSRAVSRDIPLKRLNRHCLPCERPVTWMRDSRTSRERTCPHRFERYRARPTLLMVKRDPVQGSWTWQT